MSQPTDYSVLKFWFDVGQYLITVVIAVYVWLSNRVNARAKDVEQMGNRVTKLESGSISHTDLGVVYERINKVSDQVSNISGTVDGIKGTVEMIQEYLLNNGGKK
ncbi:hypothetical protein SAMN04487931_10652 [Desulfobacula phenolica]|uniref:Uncharacterized protein n=2 Tax=Desulfobacula phenolica TaxID=90732 RepID=A0A1H2H610_9BACT|nr:hypothetical protein SAMN04487931_10652 [Desulfobacula phenolica]